MTAVPSSQGATTTRAAPDPESITHVHLAAVINSEIDPGGKPLIRLLEAGCGNGGTLAYLLQALPAMRPEMSWDAYGFDVLDSAVQEDPQFLSAAADRLKRIDPQVDWTTRLLASASDEAWPYQDDFFDVVVSNQVLEHVRDLNAFMRQLQRTLRPGGISVHLFPLRAVVNEGHVHVPLAHKMKSHDLLRKYIELSNWLGIGRFDTYNTPGDSLKDFAAKEADRLWYYTSYRTADSVLSACRSVGLRASFRYTPEFYRAKLRSLLGQNPRAAYERHMIGDTLGTWILKYVSSVTLLVEKRNEVADLRNTKP